MNWLEATFLAVWMILGVCGWFYHFQPEFRWWWSAGILDKIMMGVYMIVTLAVSLVFGLISFVLWRTSNPRNYR